MERYTEKFIKTWGDETGVFNIIKNVDWWELFKNLYPIDRLHDSADNDIKRQLCEAIDRFSAYEDLGYTPDELKIKLQLH